MTRDQRSAAYAAARKITTSHARVSLCYETAVIGRYATEREAWIAHDQAVLVGLCPDKLAVTEKARDQ